MIYTVIYMSRPKKAKTKLHANLHLSQSAKKWRKAAEDAELMITDHQKRIRHLRRAIAIFREKIEQDESWPGESPPDVREPS